MIYLIEDASNQLCKIGFSNSPEKRLATLQTGTGFTLNLLYVMEGSLKLESELHNKFKHLHKRGEWFYFSGDIKKYFKNQKKVSNKYTDKILLPVFNIETNELLGYKYFSKKETKGISYIQHDSETYSKVSLN